MTTRVFRIALAVLALTATQAAAVDDPNVVLMKKLFTKLGGVMGVGSGDTDDTFLVLANPGTLIDPTLDMTKVSDQYQLSRVLDKVMSPSWIYHPTNKSTLPLYKTVLDYHEAPAKKISAEQQKILDEARAWVFKPGTYVHTDDFKIFRAAKRNLAAVLDRVNEFKRQYPGAPLSNLLADDLDVATQDYNSINTHPKGGTFLADESTINSLGHLDPAIWWSENLTQYTLNSGNYNGGAFAKYNLYPSYSEWTDPNKEWTTITLTQSDLEQTVSSSHTSVGGGVSAGWGLWSVGADYSHQENRTYFKLDVSGYTMVFEVMRVEIDRPWMNDYVFASRAWRWLNSAPLGSADKNISDGASATAGQTPKGFMPFVPSALLLARNVTLSGSWSSDLKTTFDSQTSAGGSVGWGPFSVSGRTNSSDSSTYRKASAAGSTISFGSPQIIGYFVEVLPPSPDHDPGLNWPPTVKAAAAAAGPPDPLLTRARQILSEIERKPK